MPKTIIIRNTWRCSDCDFEWDIGGQDGCPEGDCVGHVYQTTDVSRMGTLTVVGVEDIEVEILDRDETLMRQANQDAINAQIAIADSHGEFPTEINREYQRDLRLADLEVFIAEEKAKGYFLATDEEKTTYRTAREADIVLAVAAARAREYTA